MPEYVWYEIYTNADELSFYHIFKLHTIKYVLWLCTTFILSYIMWYYGWVTCARVICSPFALCSYCKSFQK